MPCYPHFFPKQKSVSWHPWHHRRTSRIPRSCYNNCPSYLQPSTLPASFNTYWKTITKHSRRAGNQTSLNNPSCNRLNHTCSTIPANPLHNRWDQWTRPDPKSYRASMILNLRIYRLQEPNIRLLHNTSCGPATRTLPTIRSGPSCSCPNRITSSSHWYCRQCSTLMTCP